VQVAVHLATVHESSGNEGSDGLNTAATTSTSTVFAKMAAAARMRQFMSQQPPSQITMHRFMNFLFWEEHVLLQKQ